MLAELQARREAERELADRESGKPARTSVSRVAARTVFRARRLIAPFVLLAVVAALGWWGTAPDVSPVAPLAMWLGGGAVAWRYRLRDRLRRAVERRYAAGCAAAGALWLTGAAVLGPGAVDSLLVAGWAVASLPWWRHHWPRPRTEPPPVEAGESIPELWERYVADPGGPLAGAVLFHPDVTAHSQTWWVQLRRGRQDISNARAALPKVATGLDKPMHRLLFDPVPREEMPEERPSIIRMQYVVNSPIEETVYFDEPRWDGGRILLGPHADGDGEATWRLYTENSMWSGYVLGSTGSGKALDVTTPIAVPSGWTTMGDLKVGDQVFAETGEVCNVVAAHQVQAERPCFEVEFSDGEVIVADGDHLWWTEDRAARCSRARAKTHRVRREMVSSEGMQNLVDLAINQGTVTIRDVSDATGLPFKSPALRIPAAAIGPVDRSNHNGGHRFASVPLAEALAARFAKPWGDQRLKRVMGQVRTTEEIRSTLRRPGGQVNHSIPVAAPLILPESALPIAPYVLGCWLGDGSSKSSELTSADPEIADLISAEGWRCVHRGGYRYSILPLNAELPTRSVDRACPRCGQTFRTKFAAQTYCSRPCIPRRGTGATVRNCLTCALPLPSGSGLRHRACWTGGTLQGKLKALGVYRNKHIPEAYLRADLGQRRALLAGLLDTDGTVSPHGGIEFDSVNQRLAESFRELALSLGYRALIHERDATLNGRVISRVWRVSFNTSGSDSVFRLSRKQKAQQERCRYSAARSGHRYIVDVRPVPSRPVRCITVDSSSHLFLAGRAMIPTHNSRLVEGVVLTARAMPVKPITIYLDGQAGASSPALWEHATWRGGPDESLDILAALERGLRIRQKWNVVHHLAGFTPGFCPDGVVEPLTPVLVVGDEWHKIARLAPDRWADLAREQRKCGFGILAASQETSLAAFGGSDALRSSLITGNGIAMRTTSRMSAGLFPGLGGEDGLNPVDFPQLPGYGYKIAALGSGERTTAYRARFLPDGKDRAKAEKAGTPLPVPTVGEWFAKTPDGVLDEMTARAFGPVFLDRHRLAEESTRAAWDEINGVTQPEPVEPDPGERVVAGKPSRTADVIVAVLAERGPTSRADLDAEVQRRYGTGPAAVDKAIPGLLLDGRIERPSRGIYAPRVGAPLVSNSPEMDITHNMKRP